MIVQLPDEGAAAFAALQAYANLPPNDRSLVKAIQATGGNVAAKKRQYEEWSSRYSWLQRVRQADADAAAAMRAALIDKQVAVAQVGIEKLLAALEAVSPEDIARHVSALPRFIDSLGNLSRLLAGQPTSIEIQQASDADEARRSLVAWCDRVLNGGGADDE